MRPKRIQRQDSSGAVPQRRSWWRFGWEMLSGMLFALLLLAVVGLSGLVWAWIQKDQFLTAEIRKALQKQLPNAEVSFSSAEFDQRGRVVISQLEIRSQADHHPLLSVPGIRITVDRELLLAEQQVDVQLIELNRPSILVSRSAEGVWNWDGLSTESGKDRPLPLIQIRDAQVTFQFEHPEFRRAVRAQVDALDTDLVPTALHRYRFSGDGQEQTLGESRFAGEVDLANRTWDVSGQISGLRIDQPFLEAAALISPDAQKVVERWQQSNANPQTAGLESADPAASPAHLHTSLELFADIQFHSSKTGTGDPANSLFAQLVSGQIRHPDLPVALDQIRGNIALDGKGVRIDQIHIQSGRTTARISGAWGWKEHTLPVHVQEGIAVNLNSFVVTKETRDFLPRSLLKIYDELRPSGLITADFEMHRKPGNSGVDLSLNHASVEDATVQHIMFAYPVQGVSGTIRRIDGASGIETWDLNFQGLAGKCPVTAKGTVVDPGPNSQIKLVVEGNQFVIDDQFNRALTPRQREVVGHLDLQGEASVVCQIEQKLQIDPEPQLRLKIDLRNSTMRVKSFPWQLRNVAAHVEFDGKSWQVTQASGQHGETQVRGTASASPVGREWNLALDVTAENGRFDHDLYLALEKVGDVAIRPWRLLNPSGTFGLNLKLDWTSGGPVAVEIPLLTLHNCEVTPQLMPWRLAGVNGTVNVGRDGSVAFENIQARHDDCHVEASGSFLPLKDYWQLRFDELDADDLLPNSQFLAALPDQVRDLIKSVHLQDPVSLSGQVEFKGNYPGDILTAAWDMRVVLNQTDLLLGIDVNDISGSISCQGILDRNGLVTIPTGKLSIDSCWVMGYHITDIHGPFRAGENSLIVGSPKMFETEETTEEWATISREERLTGRIFDGELFLDLMVQRTANQPYLLRTTLSRASLEQWAIQSNYGQANIRGEVNGYLDLAGDNVSTRATAGTGRLLISPAALYEVPILFQMFQSLRFAPIDDTAFRHAYAEFRVMDEKFLFDEIGLLGDTMSLFGQGYIRFDRTIDLDFVYRPPRRGGINLASQVISQLDNVIPVLFTVEVDGTVDVPHVVVKDGMRETLRGFRRLLEQAPGNIRPPKILPPRQLDFQQFRNPAVNSPSIP
ncbi:MAG: hypothetical protein KDA78_06005 [Planctomycetaceae bacterium]|nr:hypothetical protein [Planctomycetaceae bacterium]